ncbi:phospholipid-translocating P-type ATPase [Backusella circina FSU 941]|nr:phospholipid-translocating P-type ATPase [Backusella circina FSU 941]
MLKRWGRTRGTYSGARTVYVNKLSAAALDDDSPVYASNEIRTSKYTWYNFLPKNMFEQFRGVANVYFLFLVILQMFPIFNAASSPVLIVLPLASILVLTGAKDAFEDTKRHQADKAVNKATTYLLSNWTNVNMPVYKHSFWGRLRALLKRKDSRPANHPTAGVQADHSLNKFQMENQDKANAYSIPEEKSLNSIDKRWKPILWEDVKVGDILYVRSDDSIPADVIVLSTSEQDGLCYIETQNLDGETNLKIKHALQSTNHIETVEDCMEISCGIESEPPHPNLYTYNGVLKWDNGDRELEPITADSMLLRGCVLRNTEWLICVAIFTGSETKIMLNSGSTPSKRSKLEKDTNPYVVINFIILIILCVICSVAAGLVYKDVTEVLFELPIASNALLSGFIMFWTSLVLYQNIIPISLYISVQIVKTAAAYFIHTDLDLYNERLDQPCIPKTWNIADDLGQIEYIFSDKTGTLTQNVMEFRRCTIHGVMYGLGETEASVGAKLRDGLTEMDDKGLLSIEESREEMIRKQAELFDHKYINAESTFVDPQIIDDLSKQNKQAQQIVHFFSALALCHTVIPEQVNPESNPYLIDYKAQSPDEAALVDTARDLGFAFLGRTQDNVVVDIMGEQTTFKLLNVLEFNSTRKRMSVIVQSEVDNKIILLCKGADSVIFERLSHFTEKLSADEAQVRETTREHLSIFANEGLRTLCIAYRILEEDEYNEWAKGYQVAFSSIENREERIELICEEIEQNFTLLGGTAIEDKLQEGVPETIALLAKAGIKIWVLTGDKVETAINIGFACNLLTKEMLLIKINASNEEEAVEQLEAALKKVKENVDYQKCALVIDGESLKYALYESCKHKLLDLGTQCRAVLCCRVSPMQKANVVTLVKKGLHVMTLAIGDGANDVSMIQEANVGIGISGEEGRQAVMASDYAIGQFSYLGKLLLVHGRWSYLRTTEMIQTFFYKNIVWTVVLFFYQFFCGFTGTMMFDYSYITLYTVLFTSLPCIVAAVLDQDLKAEYSFKYPELYLMGIRNDKFTGWKFCATIIDAFYQSVVCFGFPYILFIGPKLSSHGYDMEGVYELGAFIAGICVVVANTFVGVTIYSWTWVIFLCINLSSATFFIWTIIYSRALSFTFHGLSILFHQGNFWLCMILTFVACLLPRCAIMYYLHMYYPFDNDIIREIVLCKARAHSVCGDEENEVNEDDEIQIELIKTRSRETTKPMQEEVVEDVKLNRSQVLYRTETQETRASEILNMRTGKRTSFLGFAFSADDNHPFDSYKKSVYRRTAGSISNLIGRRRSHATKNSDERNEDWMSMNEFNLNSYDKKPPRSGNYPRFGKKVVNAVKSRLTSSKISETQLDNQENTSSSTKNRKDNNVPTEAESSGDHKRRKSDESFKNEDF